MMIISELLIPSKTEFIQYLLLSISDRQILNGFQTCCFMVVVVVVVTPIMSSTRSWLISAFNFHLKKLIVAQLVKFLPASFGILILIAALTRNCQWTLP